MFDNRFIIRGTAYRLVASTAAPRSLELAAVVVVVGEFVVGGLKREEMVIDI
jgi:hypothetical protein